MVPLDKWKGLLKKEGFGLSFELREGEEIPQTGRQRIPDRWSDGTGRTLANRFQIAFRDLQKLLASYGLLFFLNADSHICFSSSPPPNNNKKK